jgi:hypothetical protein
MTDLLAERCSAAAEPTIQLMGAAIECQTGKPESFEKVKNLAAQLRGIAEQGTQGIDQPDYVAWASGAPAVLAAMEAAAERRDSEGVWTAFSDPTVGLHRLGSACQGQPRW